MLPSFDELDSSSSRSAIVPVNISIKSSDPSKKKYHILYTYIYKMILFLWSLQLLLLCNTLALSVTTSQGWVAVRMKLHWRMSRLLSLVKSLSSRPPRNSAGLDENHSIWPLTSPTTSPIAATHITCSIRRAAVFQMSA